jgi:hypothetical protein
MAGPRRARSASPLRVVEERHVRLLTWNVENLCQPQPSEEANFDARLQALADVISAVQPDAMDRGSVQALRVPAHHPRGAGCPRSRWPTCRRSSTCPRSWRR